MVLAVFDAADELAYVPARQEQGFLLRIREVEWFEHRLLQTPHTAGHLHVFTSGCEEIDRMLAFRDWLRTHDEDLQRYEAAKFALAGRTWMYVQDYADAKSDVVQEILARALNPRKS